MKMKIFLALFLVIGMIGLGSAAKESEGQLPGKILTQDEAMEVFGNAAWNYQIPDELQQNPAERTLTTEKENKKPLTSQEIAEINAKASKGMFLVTEVEDTPMQKEVLTNAQVSEVKVKGDEITMGWLDSESLSRVSHNVYYNIRSKCCNHRCFL